MLTIPLIKQMTSDALFYYVLSNSANKPIPEGVVYPINIRDIDQGDKDFFPELVGSELNTAIEYGVSDDPDYKVGDFNTVYLKRWSLVELYGGDVVEVGSVSEQTHQGILDVLNGKLNTILTVSETEWTATSSDSFSIKVKDGVHCGIYGNIDIRVVADHLLTYDDPKPVTVSFNGKNNYVIENIIENLTVNGTLVENIDDLVNKVSIDGVKINHDYRTTFSKTKAGFFNLTISNLLIPIGVSEQQLTITITLNNKNTNYEHATLTTFVIADNQLQLNSFELPIDEEGNQVARLMVKDLINNAWVETNLIHPELRFDTNPESGVTITYTGVDGDFYHPEDEEDYYHLPVTYSGSGNFVMTIPGFKPIEGAIIDDSWELEVRNPGCTVNNGWVNFHYYIYTHDKVLRDVSNEYSVELKRPLEQIIGLSDLDDTDKGEYYYYPRSFSLDTDGKETFSFNDDPDGGRWHIIAMGMVGTNQYEFEIDISGTY